MTKKKNKHILIMLDAFTKYIKLFAVRTTSSKESIKCLSRIVSDRGTSLTEIDFFL